MAAEQKLTLGLIARTLGVEDPETIFKLKAWEAGVRVRHGEKLLSFWIAPTILQKSAPPLLEMLVAL